MSSKHVAKLICKGISIGVDKIPDSWFDAVPGGYFKAKEKAEKVQEKADEHKHALNQSLNRDRRGDSHRHRDSGRDRDRERREKERNRRHRHQGRRAHSDTYSDYDSDYLSSSDDEYLSDEERKFGGGADDKHRMRARSWDRDNRNRRHRDDHFPPSPPIVSPPHQQREFFRQNPTPHPPPYNNGPRPYNPADYASIPADGTNIPDPQAYPAGRRDSQSLYSTSSWVEDQARRPPTQDPGALVRRTTPPYPSPPYDYPGSYSYSYSYRDGSVNSNVPHGQSVRFDPQYSNALTRTTSVQQPRRSYHHSKPRSTRDKRHRPRSTSPIYVAEKRSKRDQLATPTLGAVTGGLLASEVAGAGGIGTIAGAAIGGLAMHVLDKRSRSKSKSREQAGGAAARKINTNSTIASDSSAKHSGSEHSREREKNRRRDDRSGESEQRVDGYQSY